VRRRFWYSSALIGRKFRHAAVVLATSMPKWAREYVSGASNLACHTTTLHALYKSVVARCGHTRPVQLRQRRQNFAPSPRRLGSRFPISLKTTVAGVARFFTSTADGRDNFRSMPVASRDSVGSGNLTLASFARKVSNLLPSGGLFGSECSSGARARKSRTARNSTPFARFSRIIHAIST